MVKALVFSPLLVFGLMLPANGAEGILDYNRFMSEIEPILTTTQFASPSAGTKCIDCHGSPAHAAYTVFPLITGQSRANFIATGDEVDVENPSVSLLLRKPLLLAGGGTSGHGTSGVNGGKPFDNSEDDDYQTIINWIIEASAGKRARITQTDPHPNPFRYYTDIVYFLSSDALSVNVSIFTNNGHQLRSLDGTNLVGANRVRWDGRDEFGEPLPTGLYFYRVKAEFRNDTVVKNGRIIYTP